MKTYIEYKNKIKELEDLLLTTKTLEKISASYIHILKTKYINFSFYLSSIEEILKRFSLFYKDKSFKPKGKKKMLIIILGDKGLTGGLWHNIINYFLLHKNKYQLIVSIGKKAKDYLKEEKIELRKTFENLEDIPSFEKIKEISDFILKEFKTKDIRIIDILYPKFIDLTLQIPQISTFLPLEIKFQKDIDENNIGIPIFEQKKSVIFKNIFKKYVNAYFYKFILETKLSEKASRTINLEHASTKIEDLKNETINQYIKQKRKIMTTRQIENFISHKILKNK